MLREHEEVHNVQWTLVLDRPKRSEDRSSRTFSILLQHLHIKKQALFADGSNVKHIDK